MSKWFLYILKCKDNSLYIGYTKNFNKRIIDHNITSTKKYTSKKKPWKIVYLKNFLTKNEALKEEIRLKKSKNKKYLEWLIKKFGSVAQ